MCKWMENNRSNLEKVCIVSFCVCMFIAQIEWYFEWFKMYLLDFLRLSFRTFARDEINKGF